MVTTKERRRLSSVLPAAAAAGHRPEVGITGADGALDGKPVVQSLVIPLLTACKSPRPGEIVPCLSVVLFHRPLAEILEKRVVVGTLDLFPPAGIVECHGVSRSHGDQDNEDACPHGTVCSNPQMLR
jgi:hypothetical protein